MATDVFPGAILRQVVEWGYPMGSPRPTPNPSLAFSVVHITGNKNLPSADGELTWRITDKGLQNSATFFVNRDGSIRQALGDPLHMDPWANGDVNRPDLSNPRVAALVKAGVNANERTIVAIENVGYEPGSSITPAQEKACAAIIAYYHRKAGVPINRQTIIGHYQLNSVTRPNCPAVDKRVIDRIVALAAGTTTKPAPTPAPENDMDAKPATFHRRNGSIKLAAGVKYNAFRYLGKNADGTPKLERFPATPVGFSYAAATGGSVIGLAHWDADAAPADCYMVSPYLYIPGAGWQSLVWWSKSPFPAPAVEWEKTYAEGRAAGIAAAKADLADLK